MFVAGTDTTSTTLEWAINELIKHPKAMRKLQQEVTEIAQGRSMIVEQDLEKMQYLKAVIKESLRLHAPVPLLLPRESREDVKLMGYDITASTQVIINAWEIGRDPSLWDESEEIRVERFLNKFIDYKGVNFGWSPFDNVVMELALANIVYKFDLALPKESKARIWT